MKTPPGSKLNIALCVMVKNEEKTLPRLIESYWKVFGRGAKIIAYDTGSTDGTLLYLDSIGADVLRGEFEDFGQSRTKLMQFAMLRATWLLLADADQVIKCSVDEINLDPAIRCYRLPTQSGSIRYYNTRIVRGDLYWKYVGATHEYLAGSEHASKLDCLEVEHVGDGGSKMDKFARDRRLLQADLKKDPTNSRTVFYLANTLRDMGLRDQARRMYLQRASMGDWEEEQFVARLEAAKISLGRLELWQCYASRPTRAEPLHLLQRIYTGFGETRLASCVQALRAQIPVPKDDVLFVDTFAYGDGPVDGIQIQDTIPGWFDASDVEFYRRLVSLFPAIGGTFVEIGSFVGRSMAFFDMIEKQADKTIQKVAVDTFEGTESEPNEIKSAQNFVTGFLPEFLSNMRRCDVTNFTTLKMTSTKAAATFAPGTVDAVFIDAEHTFEAVTQDIQAWFPVVRFTGFICGHDYDRPEVKRAVLAAANEKDVKVFGRCWLVAASNVFRNKNFS